MAKHFPYFKFLSSEWLTGNIVFESLEFQGLFVNICALYWQKDGEVFLSDIQKRFKDSKEIAGLSDRLATGSDRYISLRDGSKDKISIKFLDEQFAEIESVKLKNSENGRKGGLSKGLKTSELLATAKPMLATAKRPLSKEEEEKEEEEEKKDIIKEKKDKRKVKEKFTPPQLYEVIEYFNEKGFPQELAKRAFEFYDTANWVDSKGNKVKNWKQKMLSVWLKPENKTSQNGQPKPSRKPATIDDYVAKYKDAPFFKNE